MKRVGVDIIRKISLTNSRFKLDNSARGLTVKREQKLRSRCYFITALLLASTILRSYYNAVYLSLF